MRILLLLSLGCACMMGLEVHASAAPEAAAAPSTPPPAPLEEGLRKRRGYLAGAPGIVSIGLSRAPSLPSMYLWGVEGGSNFPIGRVFLVQPGGFFEHSPYRQTIRDSQSSASASVTQHWLRFGPQVRIGGGNEKVFGYALLSLVVDVFISRRYAFQGDGFRRLVLPSAHGAIGGGIQGLIADRVLLGGEADLDAGYPLAMRLRLYVGVMF